MKSAQSAKATLQTKALTGIAVFDEITSGGLPHGRTTLLVGGRVPARHYSRCNF